MRNHYNQFRTDDKLTEATRKIYNGTRDDQTDQFTMTEEALTEMSGKVKGDFTPAMLKQLKSGFAAIKSLKPGTEHHKKLVGMLNTLDKKQMAALADAEIKWVSDIAGARLNENADSLVSRASAAMTSMTKVGFGSTAPKVSGMSPSGPFGMISEGKKDSWKNMDMSHMSPKAGKKAWAKTEKKGLKRDQQDEAYNKDAVDKEIKKDTRIKGKEAKKIHGLLKGWRGSKKSVDEGKGDEPRSDYKSGSDDKQSNSARWRAEQRLKRRDQQDEEEQIDEKWDADRVRDEFDSNMNLTVAQLARMAGMSTQEVKKILMSESDLYEMKMTHNDAKKLYKQGKIDAAWKKAQEDEGLDKNMTKEKWLKWMGSLNESKSASGYEIYHKDYSTAVQHAIKQAEKQGYEVDMEDVSDKIASGPRKPSEGKTNSFHIKVTKNGKPVNKTLNMQVFNTGRKYELNMYVEEAGQIDESDDRATVLWNKVFDDLDSKFKTFDGKKMQHHQKISKYLQQQRIPQNVATSVVLDYSDYRMNIKSKDEAIKTIVQNHPPKKVNEEQIAEIAPLVAAGARALTRYAVTKAVEKGAEKIKSKMQSEEDDDEKVKKSKSDKDVVDVSDDDVVDTSPVDKDDKTKKKSEVNELSSAKLRAYKDEADKSSDHKRYKGSELARKKLGKGKKAIEPEKVRVYAKEENESFADRFTAKYYNRTVKGEE